VQDYSDVLLSADDPAFINRQFKPIIETRSTSVALFDSPIKVTNNSTKCLVNDPLEYFKRRHGGAVPVNYSKILPNSKDKELQVGAVYTYPIRCRVHT